MGSWLCLAMEARAAERTRLRQEREERRQNRELEKLREKVERQDREEKEEEEERKARIQQYIQKKRLDKEVCVSSCEWSRLLQTRALDNNSGIQGMS